MRNFNYICLTEKTWDNEILSYIANIHEYKGKQDLFLKQKPIKLERLMQIAEIQSTDASNRIEGIVTTNARLMQLFKNKITPKNREENEILGYRNVLKLIYENYKMIPITPNYILQLHRDLLKWTPVSYGGHFKTTQNEIDAMLPDGKKVVLFKPLEPYETPTAIEMICESYNYVLTKEMLDPLILIPCFILDFLCIHPFNDGNGRMSRLLTLLLLYKSGYMVGQYISIEKAIADTKNDYYDALALANVKWHEEKNDPRPFIKYMLSIILFCYRDFEQRMDITEKNVNNLAYDIVKKYVLEQIGTFTKKDVVLSCPSIGSSSVEASLKKLVDDEILIRIGAGKKTQYVRKHD